MSRERQDANGSGNRAAGATASGHGVPWRALTAAWAVAVGAATWGLMAYAQQPGALERPPADAQAVGIDTAPGRYTLVVAAHPRCACTRATAAELERLMLRADGTMDCVVLLYRPGNESDAWAQTALAERLAALPNTKVRIDVDGAQAAQIGAATSGSTVLYAPDGAAAFWGGVTAARGHEGVNLGSESIAALLRGHEPARRSMPAYGCAILVTHDGAEEATR